VAGDGGSESRVVSCGLQDRTRTRARDTPLTWKLAWFPCGQSQRQRQFFLTTRYQLLTTHYAIVKLAY